MEIVVALHGFDEHERRDTDTHGTKVQQARLL
jgi:hypothetical protein